MTVAVSLSPVIRSRDDRLMRLAYMMKPEAPPLNHGLLMRLRILAGIVILILGLALYAAAVMVIALRFLPEQILIDMLFYAAAGIAWIWPAALLTRWMQQASPYHPPPGAST
jgi:hypothetical protein